MIYVNYKTLVNTMRTQAPYRGTENRFPLGNRKQSHKYFFYDKDQDQFRIVYGRLFGNVTISKEEYDAEPDRRTVGKYPIYDNLTGKPIPNEFRHLRHTQEPNVVGIVRPDNSFEFMSKSYYSQGDRTVLSKFCPYHGYFKVDVKRGGMLYIKGSYSNIEQMLPIFKGLRVDCDTVKPDPSHEYQLIGRRVNRKASKEIIKQYEDFFKVSEAMMSSIKMTDFMEIAAEVVKQHTLNTNSNYWADAIKLAPAIDRAINMMNDSPLDAAALFCLALGDKGIGNFRWMVTNNMFLQRHNLYGEEGVINYYPSMKRAVCDELYKRHPDVLKLVEYEYGKPFPQSNWDYTVLRDGVATEQYYY